MTKGIIIIILSFLCCFAYAQQAGKCPFPAPAGKVRHDQYSKSSKDAVQESKKEMAAQQDEFDKKKYQQVVKAKGAKKRERQRLRYY